MLADPNPKKKRKQRARFNMDIHKNRSGDFYIVLKSANGNTFNHQYNTWRKAKQSADSLARSFKQGHMRKDYK